MKKIFFILLLASVNFTVAGKSPVAWDSLKMVEMPDWKKYFSEQLVEGTFVLYDQQKGKYFIYNKERFDTRYLPASTFKIFNSLVGLETKAVKNEKTVFEWDGFDRGNPNWNYSQNMADAFKNSTVWYYQELAKKIGFKNMQEWVDKCNYGNKDISGGIDNFWLRGKLRISAKEQVEFLKRLQAELLPFSKTSVDIVKKIMTEEETGTYILRAKTGWADGMNPDIGWYVGYVEREKAGENPEKKKEYFYFALNIDMPAGTKAEVRKIIARKILTEVNAI
ncbi:MAG: class D beta-lactamase [Bacteroidota bacterium]